MARPETSQHREAFEVWYQCSRNFIQASEKIGQKRANLYYWADLYNWYDRADKRDAAAAKIADLAAAKKTAELLKAQQQAGQLLRLKGVKHYATKDVEDGREALAAIKLGIDLERQALGLPDWIAKVLNASDDDITAEFAVMEHRRREALPDTEGTD